MPGYPGLGRLTDPATRDVVKTLFDELGALRRRLEALEAEVLRARETVDAGRVRITHVATPQEGSDAVTLAYLRAYVQAHLPTGATGTINTAAVQTVAVENGLVKEIT